MQARVMAAVVGLVLLIGGVLVVGFAVIRLSSGPASSECSGEDCLNDPSFLGMPLGIIGIVFGLIIGGWALGSIREERGAADTPLPGHPVDSGLPARVSLDSIQDTGVDIAGSRLYAFDLTMAVAGREPYQAKHAAVVPAALVPRLVRGASFAAQVDPDQPGQIVVRWDR